MIIMRFDYADFQFVILNPKFEIQNSKSKTLQRYNNISFCDVRNRTFFVRNRT